MNIQKIKDSERCGNNQLYVLSGSWIQGKVNFTDLQCSAVQWLIWTMIDYLWWGPYWEKRKACTVLKLRCSML